MQYVIFISIALIINGAFKWHVANLIAKTPDITTYQVKALKHIVTKSKFPMIKSQ